MSGLVRRTGRRQKLSVHRIILVLCFFLPQWSHCDLNWIRIRKEKKNKKDMSLMCSNELLLCADACPEVAPVAARDPAIMTDRRVLQQLLGLEIFSLPSSDYFAPPTELQPYMRRVVTTWMLEVCVGNSVYLWIVRFSESAHWPCFFDVPWRSPLQWPFKKGLFACPHPSPFKSLQDQLEVMSI